MNKEELIFYMYKDDSIGAKRFREIANKKYKLTDKEITNIYVKINNYQIKKYGDRIGKGDYIEFVTPEESKRISESRRSVINQKRNNY